MKLGKKFRDFQNELLNAEPAGSAPREVSEALLQYISTLAEVYRADELRPLLLSPLVNAGLRESLGVDATEAIAAVATLRARLSTADAPDAALWLAVLLKPRIEDRTASAWLGLPVDDEAVNAANRTALSAAQRLVNTPGLDIR